MSQRRLRPRYSRARRRFAELPASCRLNSKPILGGLDREPAIRPPIGQQGLGHRVADQLLHRVVKPLVLCSSYIFSGGIGATILIV